MVSTVSLPRASAERGFTMVEMITVVTILGIMAAFAIPSMRQLLQIQRVRSLAYDLYADLSFARTQAISRGHNVQIVSVNGTDWNKGWTITDTTASPTVQLRVNGQCTGPTPPSPCTLATNVNFTGNQGAITFDRSGRPNASATFNIIPTDPTATTDMKRCVTLATSGLPKSAKGTC